MKRVNRKKPTRKRGCTKTPDRWYINEHGVECVASTLADGQAIVFKISDPRDEFFQKIKKELADIPPLNLHEMISELRDEEY